LTAARLFLRPHPCHQNAHYTRLVCNAPH